MGERAVSTVAVQRGKSYWFSASGCPKMGNISISVLDAGGAVLKQAKSYSPTLCYRAERDGAVTVEVKALSLMGSYRSGTIDACFSASGCTAK